jgi:hypothetical protein
MKIAVNTRLLLPNRLEGIGTFTHNVLRRMVLDHPEHDRSRAPCQAPFVVFDLV